MLLLTKAFSSNLDLLAIRLVYNSIDFLQIIDIRDDLVAGDDVL